MRKRLRKKLRRGEFACYGAEFAIDLAPGADGEAFLDDFIAAVEAENLQMACSGHGSRWSGFMELGGPTSAQAAMTRIRTWLAGQPPVVHQRWMPMVDAG